MKGTAAGWAASIGAHMTGGALVLWSALGHAPQRRSLITAPPSAERVAVLLDLPGGGAAVPHVAAPVRRTVVRARPDPVPETMVPAAVPVDSGGGRGGGAGAATEAAPAPDMVRGGLAPRYVTGRLWAGSNARLASGASLSHAERVDSAVHVLLGRYVDSMQVDAMLRARGSQWGNSTLGINAKWITVAGVKIPTALLSLLPINLPAPSVDQVKKAQQLEEMRADIYRAAATARGYEDFKKTLQDIRDRVEFEREFERNRRNPMPALPVDTTSASQ